MINGYVARDRGGALFFFINSPERWRDKYWIAMDDWSFILNVERYPDVTWEDEPLMVETKLVLDDGREVME